jgi:nitrogen fixation/metabolism regulation signal transduction histidine kinase
MSIVEGIVGLNIRRLLQKSGLLGIATVALTGILILFIFLLVQTTHNQPKISETNYTLLLLINTIVASLLFIIIIWALWRLYGYWKQKRFGSRLLVKLALIFALLGVVPVALVYLVSYQFVTRSIESWFDIRVEKSLDAGLNLGQYYLDIQTKAVEQKIAQATRFLSNLNIEEQSANLEQLRSRLGFEDLILWREGKTLVSSAGESRFSLQLQPPNSELLSRVQTSGMAAVSLVGFGGGLVNTLQSNQVEQAKIIALAPIASEAGYTLLSETYYLEAIEIPDQRQIQAALAIQTTYREYQERALARLGLQRMYIGTLSLVLVLSIFTALLIAYLLGRQLARALIVLADGMRQVASGDLRPKKTLVHQDELSGLTHSFAQMTNQLLEARENAQKNTILLEEAKQYLQTILDNLTTGVVVLSRDLTVIQTNPGARKLLPPLFGAEGKKLSQLPSLEDIAKKIDLAFEKSYAQQKLVDKEDPIHWQNTFEVDIADTNSNHLGQKRKEKNTDLKNQAHQILLIRGATLGDNSLLIVFDDISEVISIQRLQAWAEVAKRVAHEIKNPLTPIQLSAERLLHKLSPHLSSTEKALVEKSVKTIIHQVEAMKRMVNEFRDFGRLPVGRLGLLDLNKLLSDVVQLYSSNTVADIYLHLDKQASFIWGDQQQVCQILHNLLQNAIDACYQKAQERDQKYIHVSSKRSKTGHYLWLIIEDNGGGFDKAVLKRVFEPYMTTKANGTGLGMAVVKKMVDEHQAKIEVSNYTTDQNTLGARVSIAFRTKNTS